MKIGLLYEGDLDEKPLQILIKRIIQKINPQISEFNFIPKPCGGSIEGHIRLAAILFFTTHESDIAVFIADTDGDNRKKSRIRAAVTRECRKINSSAKYAVGCPDKEFEQWILDEENSVKQLFSLPGVKPLPYPDMNAKERLKKIIDENNTDITLSIGEIYGKLTERIDIDTLIRRSPSFKSFYEQF